MILSVNVGGLLITDSVDKPVRFRIPNTQPDSTTIPPKGFLVFWADNQQQQGVLHLDIKLSGTGEDVGLFQYRNQPFQLDAASFGPQSPNVSLGRFPDGSGAWVLMANPSPGTTNNQNSQTLVTGLVINEFMARSTNTFPDEYGIFSDWIEIYNVTNQDINLAGLYMTDNFANPGMYQFPVGQEALTNVPAKSFIVIRAGGDDTMGPLFTNFLLAGGGEMIGLYQEVNGGFVVIDTVNYGVQEADVSYGRKVDGGAEFVFFDVPTPGLTNQTADELVSGIFVNELMARNQTGYSDEYGNIVDWLEIYNSNENAVDIGGLYLSDEVINPKKVRLPDNNSAATTIQAKGFLIIWPDANPALGPLHVDFQLAGAGEAVLISADVAGTTVIIDSVTYPVQNADVSYGRVRDGDPTWTYYVTPSPKKTNNSSGIENSLRLESAVRVYPNPAKTKLFIEFSTLESGIGHVELISLSGQLLISKRIQYGGSSGIIGIDFSESATKINTGVYFLRIHSSDKSFTKRIVVLK